LDFVSFGLNLGLTHRYVGTSLLQRACTVPGQRGRDGDHARVPVSSHLTVVPQSEVRQSVVRVQKLYVPINKPMQYARGRVNSLQQGNT
jgi:hypothetical protein